MGQKGSPSYRWALVGSRHPMVRDSHQHTAKLIGAICPARAIGTAVITPPTVNTECMKLHLAEIREQVTPGAVAVMVCDGAG